MTRWLVQLEGERFDLEEFPRWFTHDPLYALTLNGDVFLVGPKLEECADADQVRATAIAELHEMFGVLKLLVGNLHRPSVGRLVREHDDGRRENFVAVSGAVHSRSKAVASLSGGSVAQNSQAEELLAAARSSRYLRHALDLWATDNLTWSRLYALLETLEQHLGVPADAAQLCSKAERGRFARTANTAEVSGRESRHAPGLFEPPPKPMSLKEATAFIEQLLGKALRMSGAV